MAVSEEKPALKDGYYWVRVFPDTGWEIALLEGGFWCINGGKLRPFDYVHTVGPFIPEPT